MNNFHRLLLATVFLLPSALRSQEIIRGERPFIDLNQIPADAYEKGKLNIKFKPSATSFLRSTLSKNNGIASFGNTSIDELNRKFTVTNTSRVFEATLRDKQYDARHKAWGLDLWYQLELPGNINVLDAVKAYAALGTIIEIAEPENKKILYDQNSKFSWT